MTPKKIIVLGLMIGLCGGTIAEVRSFPAPWSEILRSAGFDGSAANLNHVFVVRAGATPPADGWLRLAEEGACLILEGPSPAAEAMGFIVTRDVVTVRDIVSKHDPTRNIRWPEPVASPRCRIPDDAVVFAREKYSDAPLLAGRRIGRGSALFLAVDPGPQGWERFTNLGQALVDLGVKPRFASRRLWAFMDSAYRLEQDPRALARQWRNAGLAALHVSAWYYCDGDPEQDAYLEKLIAACHEQGLLIYAWLEFPHVSEDFWNAHPEWREKTAALTDAFVDWRKLMNLTDPDCHRAVAEATRRMLMRFDWDGVNLAELYFESLLGLSAPERFTPMNDMVRRRFSGEHGFDPIELFRPASPHFHDKDPRGLKKFLDFRRVLACQLQERWMAELDGLRREKPHLDLVLTHIDDRFDASMSDLLGVDAVRLVRLLDRHDMTFMIEDPAPLWNLGPARYPEIAKRYEPLTPHKERLSVDINVVERTEDVYPTSLQTGGELSRLVQLASRAFARVTFYCESSVAETDLPLLPHAGAVVDSVEKTSGGFSIRTPRGVWLRHENPAAVDGVPWPARDGDWIFLPAGRHRISSSGSEPPFKICDFNGDLKNVVPQKSGLTLRYQSFSRAFAVFNQAPRAATVDGRPYSVSSRPHEKGWILSLPKGRHRVLVTF